MIDGASPTGLPHVVFAIGGLGRGGSEIQMLRLIELTHGRDCRATVVTFSPHATNEARETLRHLGVDLVSLSPRRLPRPMRPPVVAGHLVRLFRALRPDVVYPWLEQASATSAPVAFALGIPVVVGRRNVSGIGVERWAPIRRAIWAIERRAPIVTVNSEAALEAAVRRGIRRERLRLVRNGHEALPVLPPPGGAETRLGCLANFRAEKGHRRLLEALARLRTDTPWTCLLAGDGPLAGAVAERVAELELADRVRIVGAVEDARAFWAATDIAVLFSDHEGCPNALIEAAFAGRPLVATAVGGTDEVVPADGGALVDTDDPEGAAAAMAELIGSAERRRAAGLAAHAHVSARYTLDAFATGHMAAVEEVFARPR